MTAPALSVAAAPSLRWRWLRKHPTLIVGAILLIAMAVIALAAPWLATHDPQDIDPLARLQPPSAEHRFGTDALGRDVYSRAVLGGRVSLIVGITVAVACPASSASSSASSPASCAPPMASSCA